MAKIIIEQYGETKVIEDVLDWQFWTKNDVLDCIDAEIGDKLKELSTEQIDDVVRYVTDGLKNAEYFVSDTSDFYDIVSEGLNGIGIEV